MTEKDPRGDIASQRPRSPRVPVEFDLNVEGTDASGKSFSAKAKAVKISRGGATLLVDVDVALGSQVKLVPPFGGKLEAEVNGTSTVTDASESNSSTPTDGSLNSCSHKRHKKHKMYFGFKSQKFINHFVLFVPFVANMN
jgi:hypothetical protein